MAELLVRNVESKIIRALKQRAAAHGVSDEEEHRRILSEALKPEPKLSFEAFLSEGSEPWPEDFVIPERSRDTGAHRVSDFS